MDLPGVLREKLLVHEDAALGPLTTLGVGGKAPFVLQPLDRHELLLCVRELRAAGLPFRLLGHGSNLLVRDEGVREIVLHTRRMLGIWHHGEIEHALRVEAGASLARLTSVAQRLQAGDVCVVMGAGDVDGLAGRIAGTSAGP